MKKCARCSLTKPPLEFWKSNQNKDGRGSWCKECNRAYSKLPHNIEVRKISAKKWYARKGRTYSRNYRRREDVKRKHWIYRHTPNAILVRRKRDALVRLNRTNKNRARDAVKYAVISGKIPPVRNLLCCYCSRQANEYDHYLGYSREHYLSVQPLCWTCHRQIESSRRMLEESNSDSV